MKQRDEIQDRIRALLDVELARRLSVTGQRQPHLCRYNHRQPLDSRKHLAGDPNDGYNRLDRHRLPVVNTLGLCMMGVEDPMTWPGTICDDPVDAQRCPYFDSVQTHAQLVAEFETQVTDPDWLRENLPAVYELVWTLDMAPPNYRVSWWKRTWLRLKGRKQSEHLPVDVHLLLPEHTENHGDT